MINSLSKRQLYDIQVLEYEILLELDRICKKNNINYVLAGGTLLGAVRHNGFIPWDDDVDVYMLREDYEKFRSIAPNMLSKQYFYQSNRTDPEYYYLYDKIRLNGTIFEENSIAGYDIHQGLYIDIFPVDYTSQESLKFKFQYYKFKFYRNGLMAKYIRLNSRTGKKKVAAIFMRIFYSFFSKKMLYDLAEKVAKQKKSGKFTVCFSSPDAIREYLPVEYYQEIKKIRFLDTILPIPRQYNNILTKKYGDYMSLPPENKRKTRHSLKKLRI